MRRTLLALALLLALPLAAQDTGAAYKLDNVAVRLDGQAGGAASYSAIAAPSGCAAGYLAVFLGSPVRLNCDAGLTYSTTTDTLTATSGTVAASNLTATALTTPVITPPIANVLSLFTTVTVVAGASLADGDFFTLSDGSAVVYEFDSAPAGVTAGRVAITFTGAESAQAIRDLVVVAINGSTLEATAIAAAADTLTVTSDTAGDSMGVNSENVANAGFLVPAWGEPTHATTYGYKVEACLASGACAPSAEVQTATGHATLSNANYNSVTWGAVTGASYYKLTRVTGTPSGGDAPPRLLYTGPLLTFQDTNAASTSEAVATGNETGVITAAKFVGPGLGITNSAGANVIPKSDGTNLVASNLSDSGTAVTSTVPVRMPSGSASSSAIGGAQADSGIWFRGGVGESVVISDRGINVAHVRKSDGGFKVVQLALVAGEPMTGDATGAPSFYATSPATATLQLGTVNSATPAGQRLQSQGATGTNISGSDLIVAAGGGTGLANTTAAGRRGDYRVRTQVRGTTGTTADTTGTDRFLAAGQVVTLTESSATPILDYAVASGSVAGGTVWYTIRADDATDFQALRGQVQWAAVNKGGTLTASIVAVGTETAAVSAGTLTNTPTITTGTNSITINLNAVSSLTQTTLYAFVSGQMDGTGVSTTK